MTLHWWHVLISYALTAVVFGALAGGAALRHRTAKRMLAKLDPRGDRS
ncbi:heme exporter protein CcmD [Roseomonas sp. HJA6]|uniref:Heme exporter protein D n=1 Tax=Roseomonas alba TaxID=2846776 RepID=A0ABS7ACV8_9PROT|nr:heme exporter protein CcmD [Neoroseomonas alba]MBW6400138.1 heme exporter protein CcmD [Neoroseomonas alba]